jgi:Carboxypeptidase regulatory-like domain
MRMRNLLGIILALILAGTSVAQSAKVKGRVMDSTGSIMPGVQVKLYQGDKVVQQGLTTDTGEFEIPAAPGDYKLEVTAPDFNTYTEMIKVTPELATLAVTMQLATIAQNVEVTETRNEISIDSDSSLQTTVLKQDFIETLPDDEDELTNYLSQIAGSRGGNGATFVIDGFTGGRVPPKDQIQEIRINNNPFSTEFSGIGYGRAEIITKAGTGDYHGNLNFEFRDASMNARNPFSFVAQPNGTLVPSKPPAQTKNIQSQFSGPIIRNKLSLNLNMRKLVQENTNIIRAKVVGTDGNPADYSAPYVSPNDNKNLNARSQYAINKNNAFFFTYQNQHQQRLNQLGGVTTLQDRASDNYIRNSEIQMRETAILTKSMVHEIRFEYRKDFSQTTPRVVGQAVNVLDSFSAGGGQNNSLSNNKSVEVDNMLMYSGTKWTVKTGFQSLNHMNHSAQQNNFLGTYTFSSLGDYIINNPLQYTQTFGNPLLDVNQFEAGLFVQTDYKMTKKFNLSLGGRYEVQSNLAYHKGFDPRVAFAYELTKTMALRGGIGTFRQRLDESIVENLLRLDGTRQSQITIFKPSYQPGCELGGTCNPLLSGTGTTLPQPPGTFRTRAADLVSPYTQNVSLSLEKTLPGGVGLTFSWDYQKGEHLYRSRNINAPINGVIPDPTKGIVYQLESSGTSRSNRYTIGWREQMRNRTNLVIFGNYTLGFAKNDTDGWQSTPVNSYDLRSEWGRAGNDVRHTVFTGAQFRLPWTLSVTTQVNWQSKQPYNITTGGDCNGDLVINDRPTDAALSQYLADKAAGVVQNSTYYCGISGRTIARNTAVGAGLFNVQMNVQKTIRLKREKKDPATAGNPRPNGVNNFAGQGFPGGGGGGFPGGGFPGGGGGGQRGGGDFGGGQGGNRGGGTFGGNRGNNGGFNQNTTGPTMTIRINAQNVFNNVQYNNYVGTMSSTFFGSTNSARNPRQMLAELRFNF